MPQLAEAEDTVRIDCRIAGFDPDQIRDAQLYRKYVLYRWHADVIKARLMSGADVGIMLEIAEKDYSRLMEKTLSTTLRAWVDTGTEGGITPEPARQLWFASR
jgi:predicted nucleic acid-binding protein